MKLTIERIGRIKRAELDLRPLTVFIGPNNTNKTWTAYLLHMTLQMLSRARTLEAVRDTKDESEKEVENRLREKLKTLIDAPNLNPAPASIECSFDIAPLFEGLPDKWDFFCEKEDIDGILNLPEGSLSDGIVTLSGARSEFATSLTSFKVVLEPARNRLTLHSRHRDATEESEETHIAVGGPWTEERLVDFIYNQLWNLIANVLVFPAERSGILPIWPMLLAARRPNVAVPVSEFAQFLQAAQGAPVRKSTPNDASSNLSEYLQQVAGGSVIYVDDTDGSKRLVFRTNAGNELPLHAAASLSKSVAGLALYIDQFFHSDDVLIIDELEMNAHPEAQLALTELMAVLVNSGIRIIFTTHSPYVVDHLNNLMEAARVPAAKQVQLASKFALGTAASFISSDRVAVHAFEERSSSGEVIVRDVLNRESGLIDWSTFSRVSERVANLYGDILTATEDKP